MQLPLKAKFDYYGLYGVTNHNILHIPTHYELYKKQQMVLHEINRY
jgi:hypothetical protein